MLACTALAQPAPGTPQQPPTQPSCDKDCTAKPSCVKKGSLCVLSHCDSCLSELWRRTQHRCADDTEARVVCADISSATSITGQAIFDILEAQKKETDKTTGKMGYAAVVIAKLSKRQTIQWSTCYRRKGSTADSCDCKCQVLLKAVPGGFKKCRCVKGT